MMSCRVLELLLRCLENEGQQRLSISLLEQTEQLMKLFTMFVDSLINELRAYRGVGWGQFFHLGIQGVRVHNIPRRDNLHKADFS
jgi:hypothetical protein